jgi:hypothetical protein
MRLAQANDGSMTDWAKEDAERRLILFQIWAETGYWSVHPLALAGNLSPGHRIAQYCPHAQIRPLRHARKIGGGQAATFVASSANAGEGIGH